MANILFTFGNNSKYNNENNSFMNTLWTLCIILKFNNNKIVDNMLVVKPSYNEVEAFANIASIQISCCC